MSEASETTGWDELQQAAAAAAAADTSPQPAWWQEYIDQAKAWWQKAVWWQRGVAALMAFAVLTVVTVVVVGGAMVGGKALFPQERPVAAAAPTAAPTATPMPTPTPIPTATPTPLPRLVVWSPAGNCAYVRPTPGVDDDPLACVPNGTQVVDQGERKQIGGLNWAKVQYPTKEGYAAAGWMAYQTVAWPFSPNAVTTDRQAALYDADRASVIRWLSPHTPVLVDHKEGGWAWVQLPNKTWGWVKNKALQAAP